MNSKIFRKSLINAIPFILGLIIFIWMLYFYEYDSNAGLKWFVEFNIFDLYSLILISAFIFLPILFYFLFKYQQEEFRSVSVFWKIPLIGGFIGIIFTIIFSIYAIATCSAEGCIGIFFSIMYIPVVFLAAALFAFIFSFNSWFRTNLYLVSWLTFIIFAFDIINTMTIPESGGSLIWLFVSISILFLPTIIAIIFRKFVNLKNKWHLSVVILLTLLMMYFMVLTLYGNKLANDGSLPLITEEDACKYIEASPPINCEYGNYSCGWDYPRLGIKKDEKGDYWTLDYRCLNQGGDFTGLGQKLKIYKDSGAIETIKIIQNQSVK